MSSQQLQQSKAMEQNIAALWWKRPESVPYPSFQKRYVGRRTLKGSSGDTPPTYIIQELPDDRLEEAKGLMADVLLSEEPLIAAFGILDDPEAVEEMNQVWYKLTSQRLSVCALLEQPDGSLGPLVALNMLVVNTPGEDGKPKCEKIVGLVNAVRRFEALVQPDVYTRFGVPEYLSSVGLMTAREHRRQGLGEQLLRARWDLGRVLGLRATSSMFTAPASQLLATRAGFHTLAEAKYADDEDPIVRSITSSSSMKIMAAALD